MKIRIEVELDTETDSQEIAELLQVVAVFKERQEETNRDKEKSGPR